MLRSEHFGHLGQGAGAAERDKSVAESADKGVCGDSRKSVASAALKSDLELGDMHGLTLEGVGVCLQLLYKPYALCYLVGKVLRVKEFDALVVPLAKNRFKNVDIVIFASETEHEHAACVWVVDHSAKDVLRCGLVVAQLGAAEGVREIFCARKLCQLFGDLIYTADGVDDPDIVSDTDLTVLADVAHKGEVAVGLFVVALCILIGVIKLARKVGLDVVGVDVLARLDILGRVTDRLTVFYYVLAVFDIAKGVFVTVREVYAHVIKLIYYKQIGKVIFFRHTLLPLFQGRRDRCPKAFRWQGSRRRWRTS